MNSMTITAPDGAGTFTAYVSEPRSTPAGAVVVIQEIFGVNDAMRATAAEIAGLGFIAVVPDLFWRLQPGIDLTDKSDAEWQQAMGYLKAFDQDKGVDDLRATLAAARAMPGCNGRAGTIGYCLGGRLAMMMATRSDADVNVSYYGVGLDNLLPELPQVRTPLLLHIAGADAFFPAAGRARVLEAVKGHPSIQAWEYAGADHAFARVGGTHYEALPATIANGRTAEALASALQG